MPAELVWSAKIADENKWDLDSLYNAALKTITYMPGYVIYAVIPIINELRLACVIRNPVEYNYGTVVGIFDGKSV